MNSKIPQLSPKLLHDTKSHYLPWHTKFIKHYIDLIVQAGPEEQLTVINFTGKLEPSVCFNYSCTEKNSLLPKRQKVQHIDTSSFQCSVPQDFFELGNMRCSHPTAINGKLKEKLQSGKWRHKAVFMCHIFICIRHLTRAETSCPLHSPDHP